MTTRIHDLLDLPEAVRKGDFVQDLTGGIGNPDEVRKNMETFEDVGVDQIIFIQQGGNNRHEHICESLELFGREIMPEFKEVAYAIFNGGKYRNLALGAGTEERSAHSIGDAAGEGLLHGWIAIGKAL